MLNNKKIVVVFPAYNAEKTIEQTYNEIPKDIVDDVILVGGSTRIPKIQQLLSNFFNGKKLRC